MRARLRSFFTPPPTAGEPARLLQLYQYTTAVGVFARMLSLLGEAAKETHTHARVRAVNQGREQHPFTSLSPTCLIN